MKAEPKREASEALLRRELGARPGSLEACSCDLCGTMEVSSEASSGFLVLLAAGMDLGVRLAKRSCKPALFTFREDGASELISVCLKLKYDPLPIGEIVGTDKNGNPNDTRIEVTPVEESVWLVEQRAVAATKPGARRPCLAEKDRSWDRQIGRRIRRDPQHFQSVM